MVNQISEDYQIKQRRLEEQGENLKQRLIKLTTDYVKSVNQNSTEKKDESLLIKPTN